MTWPQAITRTCVVHLLPASFRYASKNEWPALTKDLRPICTGPSKQAALDRFAEFAATWEPVPVTAGHLAGVT